MISNADYLIQKYAEAREKMNATCNYDEEQYWQGVMDTYWQLLDAGWGASWCAPDSVGYYVFIEQMTYDEALNQVTGTLVDC